MNLILIVLLAAVVLLPIARWLKNKKSASPKASRRQQPSVAGKGATRNSRSRRFEIQPLSSEDLSLQGSLQADALQAESSLSQPAAEAPSDLIVIHAMAEEGKPYQGYDLLQALLANNLRFGDRKIFHCFDSASKSENPLYSVASINKPGTFDLPKMGNFSCDGLVFFMQLKHIADPVSALQAMLDAAEKLIASLGGHLTNERRQLLSTDAAAQMREQAAYYACENVKTAVNE
jgi:cell division protein ZipA